MECPYEEREPGYFVCPRCGDVRTKRVRRNCPTRHRGVGDSIARLLAKLGVTKKCSPCQQRQAALNRLFPYSLDRWRTRLAHTAHVVADLPHWLLPGNRPRPPRILHVCRTLGTACGIANFARNLHEAATCAGAEIETVKEPPGELSQYDVALIQHENGLYLRAPEGLENLARQLADAGVPRVLFVHSSTQLDQFADAYIAMNESMVETSLPVHLMPHPAHVLPPADRSRLREHLRLDRYRTLIGSHGFITPARRFDDFIERLAPLLNELEGGLLLAVAEHAKANDAMRRAANRLFRVVAKHPNVILARGFMQADDVNLLMQACDLTWCWTSTASRPYASGVASDLYGTGTRLVVADKRQHAAVVGRENVVAAPPDFDAFVRQLATEIVRGDHPRHDPSALSWENQIPGLLQFLYDTAGAKAR